jgi:hypothetical protein
MDLFDNENENRNYIYDKLKEHTYLQEEELKIGKEIPVPYKHIYIPYSENELEIWCFKQDICIYETLFDKEIGHKDAIISSCDVPILTVRLEKDNVQKTKDVGLPYTIIETKMAKRINTNELLAYSEKIKMIKTIFPYCISFLLFFGIPPARAFRHGAEFDEIIFIEDISDLRCNCVIEKIINGTKKARNKIQYIVSS